MRIYWYSPPPLNCWCCHGTGTVHRSFQHSKRMWTWIKTMMNVTSGATLWGRPGWLEVNWTWRPFTSCPGENCRSSEKLEILLHERWNIFKPSCSTSRRQGWRRTFTGIFLPSIQQRLQKYLSGFISTGNEGIKLNKSLIEDDSILSCRQVYHR